MTTVLNTPRLNGPNNYPMMGNIGSQVEKTSFTGPLMNTNEPVMPGGYGYTQSMHTFPWAQLGSQSTLFLGATWEALTVALDGMQDILPIEKTDVLNFQWVKFFAMEAELVPRAPLGPGPLLSTGQVIYNATVSHFNLGFEMENGFAQTALGQRMYAYNLMIMSHAVIKRANQLRIEAILRCYETAKRVQNALGFNCVSIGQVLQKELNMFAAVQKDTGIQTAFASLVSSMKTAYASARNNVVPTTIIMPQKMERYLTLSNKTNFDGGIVGLEERQRRLTDFPYQKSFGDMDIRLIMSYTDDNRNDFINPLGQTVQIGDMFALDQVGTPSCESNEKYCTDNLTRWVMDMSCNNGEFKPVTMLSALKHCRRFDRTGYLDHNHQKLADDMNNGGMGINPFTVTNNCPDMFLCRDSTNGSSNYRVAKYFGDMERLYNTFEFLDAFAQTGSCKIKKLLGEKCLNDLLEGERLMEDIYDYHLTYDQVDHLLRDIVPYYIKKNTKGGPAINSGSETSAATKLACYKCAGLGNFVGIRTISLWSTELVRAANDVKSLPAGSASPDRYLNLSECVMNAEKTLEIVKVARAYEHAVLSLFKTVADHFSHNFLFDQDNLPSVWRIKDVFCNSVNMFGMSVLDKASKFPVLKSYQRTGGISGQNTDIAYMYPDLPDKLYNAPLNFSSSNASDLIRVVLSPNMDSSYIKDFCSNPSGFHTKYVQKFGRVYAQTLNRKDGSPRSSNFASFTDDVTNTYNNGIKASNVIKGVIRFVLDDTISDTIMTPQNIDNFISSLAKLNVNRPTHSSSRPSMKSDIDNDKVDVLDTSYRFIQIVGLTFSDETIEDCIRHTQGQDPDTRTLIADVSYISYMGQLYDGLSANKDKGLSRDLEEAFKLQSLSDINTTTTLKTLDPTFNRFKNLSGKGYDHGQDHRPPEESWRSIGDFQKVTKSGDIVWNGPLIEAWKYVVTSSGKCSVTRAVGLLYLMEHINLHSLTVWSTKNLRLPFGMLMFRPFKRYETSVMAMLKPGRETGVLVMGNEDWEQGNNVQIKYQTVHLSINLGAIIYAPENIFLMLHSIVDAYKSGEGLEFFDSDDFTVVEGHVLLSHDKSVFAAMVPYRSTDGINDELIPVMNPCDISGRWADNYASRLTDRNVNAHDPSMIKPHYPSAAYYNYVWGFSAVSSAPGIYSGDYYDPSTELNRLCWRTTQRLKDGRFIRGTDHFGDELTFDGCKQRRVVGVEPISSKDIPDEVGRRIYV